MQVFKYIFLVSILLQVQMVGATTAVFGTAAQTRYARQLSPPKGKALIYIYQRKQGGAVSPKVWLNNYEIGRIVPGSFTVWQLAPGRLELRVGGTNPSRLSTVSQAGKVYLYRLSVTRTDAGTRAVIESMPQGNREELADSRLIKNPRQVTAAVSPPLTSKSASSPTSKTPASAHPKARVHPRAEVALKPGGMILLLKTGTLSLSKPTQNIVSADRNFDKSASGIYAIEFDYQFHDGLTVGGELLGYKTSYTTVGSAGTGDISVHALMANIKQSYRTEYQVQPYLGIGIGAALTDVSGAISGNTAGLAYQVLAGLEYRTASVGMFAEAKYVGANTKSSNSQSIDASASGIFAGVAFHF